MRDVSVAASLTSDLFPRQNSATPIHLASGHTPRETSNPALLDVLRESLEDTTQSTESILTAIADAARVLSGADGTALALRANGTIVCRARSGKISPQLGTPLNTDSGISGECLRSATILVASDTLRDTRVDPVVCRSLGIRSIAVVPLRGPLGMAGILEAFSSHAGAFENEQIDCLRELGEIAERAHTRDQHPLESFASLPSVRAALTSSVALRLRRAPGLLRRVFSRKNYRVIAAFAIAALLISIVVWSSWRQTQAEIVASETPARNAGYAAINGTADSAHPLRTLPLSPGSRVATVRSDQPQSTAMLHKAADLSAAEDEPIKSSAETADRGSSAPIAAQPVAKHAIEAAIDEAPPTVNLAPNDNSGALVSIMTTPATLPQFGGVTSQGLMQANLIHRVEPQYPWRAQLQRLGGSVELDATITPQGRVRATKLVSGDPVLAEAAATAVKNWRFSPATLDGNPIEVQMRVTVVFKLP
jgi:TonB family protein